MSNQKLVSVIDYGMGNLRSVAKAAEHVAPEQVRIQITDDADVIRDSDAVIFLAKARPKPA